MSSPSPVCTSFTPPVNVIASLPEPPVSLFPLPIVSVRLAEAPVLAIYISICSLEEYLMPLFRYQESSRLVSAPPEFEITTKLSFPDVTVASEIPVPAISIKTFSLVIELAGPTSSKIKSNDVIEFA